MRIKTLSFVKTSQLIGQAGSLAIKEVIIQLLVTTQNDQNLIVVYAHVDGRFVRPL
jgi:hypothetical protein